MQIALRQALWTEGARGTVVEVEMTKETGLYFKLAFHSEQGMPLSVAWGDGARHTRRGRVGRDALRRVRRTEARHEPPFGEAMKRHVVLPRRGRRESAHRFKKCNWATACCPIVRNP